MIKKPISYCKVCKKYTRTCACAAPKRKVNASRCLLYGTARWKMIRKEQLILFPLCAVCEMIAIDVDHIVPHRCDEHSFFSGEVQSLCKSCHSKKTNKGF